MTRRDAVLNSVQLLIDQLDQKLDALPQAKLHFIEDRLREILMMLGDPIAEEAMQAQYGDRETSDPPPEEGTDERQ